MHAHHYLGALPKISNTLWYVAKYKEQWLAVLSFSASALKCAARDQWLGCSFACYFGVPRGTYLLAVESTAQEAATHRTCYRVLSVCG